MKAKLIFISLLTPLFISAQVYLAENFNSGIPAGWTVSTPACGNSSDTIVWMATTDGWRGQGLSGFSLDSTEFVVVDSDLPSLFCICNEFLTSPVLNTSAASTLFLEFDQYFRYYTGGYSEIGEVQVYDATVFTWVVVASYTASSGAWMAPAHESINITPYINAGMQIRFRYNANWDWFWALDNITVTENPVLATMTVSDDDKFAFYPNPATNELKIDNGELKIEKVELYNTVGEVVRNYQLSTINYQLSVDVSQLPPGIYFITITNQAGNKVTKKVVKM